LPKIVKLRTKRGMEYHVINKHTGKRIARFYGKNAYARALKLKMKGYY